MHLLPKSNLLWSSIDIEVSRSRIRSFVFMSLIFNPVLFAASSMFKNIYCNTWTLVRNFSCSVIIFNFWQGVNFWFSYVNCLPIIYLSSISFCVLPTTCYVFCYLAVCVCLPMLAFQYVFYFLSVQLLFVWVDRGTYFQHNTIIISNKMTKRFYVFYFFANSSTIEIIWK